jgi:ATP-dependent Clp protease ATP-binding subunit ClpA
MLRLVQTKIKKPLAEDILFGKLVSGGDVQVSVVDNDIHLDIESPKTSAAADKKSREVDADA